MDHDEVQNCLAELEEAVEIMPLADRQRLAAALAQVRDALAGRARAAVYSPVDFQHMVEAVRDFAIFSMDVTGRISSWNVGAERLLGFSEAEAIGQGADIIFTAEDRAAGIPQQEIEEARESGQAIDERWHIRKDGSRFWASGFVTPLLDAAGQLIGFSKILHNTTAHKLLEEEREQLLAQVAIQSAWLETIMQQMPAGLAIAEAPSGKLLLHNEAAVRFLGHPMLSSQDYTGYVQYGALQPDDTPYPPKQYPMARALLLGEVVDQEEMRYRRGDGTITYFAVSAAPIRSDDGRIIAAVCTFYDIASRKETEQELARLYVAEQQARAEAEGALGVRDSFLAIAAHELKTPLTSLLGYAQVLARRLPTELLSDRDRRALAAVVSQSQRLHGLIDSLFDISRLHLGKLALDRRRIDLCALASEVIGEVEVMIEEHTLSVACSSDEVWVEGDPLRLEQVIQNLLQNAIKYSPGGGHIEVVVGAEEGSALMRVSDQGIGIASEAQQRLFEQFYRASNVEGSSITGLGIGLYVVREIITLHGGTIAVESAPGKGSTFTVLLPLVPLV